MGRCEDADADECEGEWEEEGSWCPGKDKREEFFLFLYLFNFFEDKLPVEKSADIYLYLFKFYIYLKNTVLKSVI